MNYSLKLTSIVLFNILLIFNYSIAQNSFNPAYHNYNEMTQILKNLANKHSNLRKFQFNESG
jgi:hypothetical protein